MIITAKFASVCPCCSTRIAVGAKVEWTRGEKAKHVACANGVAQSVAAAPVASAARRFGRAGYRSGAGSAAPVAGYSSWCTDRPGRGLLVMVHRSPGVQLLRLPVRARTPERAPAPKR